MHIVCFGDSNTWGYQVDGTRIPFEKRFPGLLAAACPQHQIAEEGLCGRTVGTPDPLWGNGLDDLPMVLKTHDPVNLLILMLGTNDTKIHYHNTAHSICLSMERLIQLAQDVSRRTMTGTQPKILLVSPPAMGERIQGSPEFDAASRTLVEQLDTAYAKLAEQYGIAFLHGIQICAGTSADGVHLTEKEHAQLAELLVKKRREIGF